MRLHDEAGRLRKAISDVLNLDKVRTGDLHGSAGTAQYGKAVAARIANG